jgi:5'-nucleotidase
LLWQAEQLAGDFGVAVPDVALQNGGGIRNNTVIPAGPISELDTFDMVPFSNFVTVIPNLDRDDFRQVLERAVSGAPDAEGRFAQVSGFQFVYDTSGTAQVIDTDTGEIITPGDRVESIVLDDTTVICCDVVNDVFPGADIGVATIDFLARGGDGYPFLGAPFTSVGQSYQQALFNYITSPTGNGGLGGTITSGDYPEGGEGRITDATP